MLEFLLKKVVLFKKLNADGTSLLSIEMPVYSFFIIAIAIIIIVAIGVILGLKAAKKKEKSARNTIVKTVTLGSEYGDNIQTAQTEPAQKGKKGDKAKEVTTANIAMAQSKKNSNDMDFLNELGFDDETGVSEKEPIIQSAIAPPAVSADLGDFVISKKVITEAPQGKRKRFSAYGSKSETTTTDAPPANEVESLAVAETPIKNEEKLTSETRIISEPEKSQPVETELNSFYAGKTTEKPADLKSFYGGSTYSEAPTNTQATTVTTTTEIQKDITSTAEQNNIKTTVETPQQEEIIINARATPSDPRVITKNLVGKYVGNPSGATTEVVKVRETAMDTLFDFASLEEVATVAATKTGVIAEKVSKPDKIVPIPKKPSAPKKPAAEKKTVAETSEIVKKPVAPKKPSAPKKPTTTKPNETTKIK